jgi:hypothetical protein
MKKIINGKLYDTDKARYLGGDSAGDGFSSWSEELYQKRTGEFFLYGEGGPMTKYAENVSDNTWTGGEKIMPLSLDAARQWAEEHLSADDYAEIFGMPSEDAEPVALNIQIDAVLMARIKEKAAEDGASLTATVAALLEKGLENAH